MPVQELVQKEVHVGELFSHQPLFVLKSFLPFCQLTFDIFSVVGVAEIHRFELVSVPNEGLSGTEALVKTESPSDVLFHPFVLFSPGRANGVPEHSTPLRKTSWNAYPRSAASCS